MPFIAVTSFLCLRFVSPAIMAPKLFHLRERHADARTSRTLLLLAKVRARGRWRDARPGARGGPCLDSGVPPTGSGNTCSTALYSLQSVFTGTDLVWMRKRVSEGQEVPQGRVACV